MDPDSQLQKLRTFIGPVRQLWQDPEMGEAISSFSGFCELIGLNKVSGYLVSRRAHEIQDWSLHQLDAEGQAIQKELDERVRVSKSPSLPHNQLLSSLGLAAAHYQVLLWLFNRKDCENEPIIQSHLRFMA